MIAFISSTPHQTWNAIVMAKKLFPTEKCDLYLIDHCADYMESVNLLNKETVFEDIIPCRMMELLCSRYKNSVVRKIRRALYFIGWRGYLKKHAPVKNKKYSKVFIAVHDEARCFILSKMKKNNKDIEAFYYEDGANDYLYEPHGIHSGAKVKLAKLVGLNYNVGHGIKKSYVLNPECVVGNDFENLQIPIVDKTKDEELIALLNRAFHYKPYPIDEKIVYLFNRIPSVATEIEHSINKIVGIYGYNNLILKDHPRLPAQGYENIKRIPKEYETLWEGMCANVDYSNKILISHCSTALYIPKFVFDQEPVLIFLFDLYRAASFEKNGERLALQRFVKKLKNTYRDHDKVFVPQTEAELFAFLEKVMNENGKCE